MSRLAGAIAAQEIAPLARASERSEMLRRLSIEPGLVVVELAAWDGYLTRELRATGVEVIAIETDVAMATHYGHRLGGLDSIPCKPGSVDRVAIMVGLHHRPRWYRNSAFRAARKMLKPGGRIVVCEVAARSETARFLDSIDGHCGDFYARGEMTLALRAVGFVDVRETSVACAWEFTSKAQAAAYVRAMFDVPRSPPVEASIRWPLLFADGVAS